MTLYNRCFWKVEGLPGKQKVAKLGKQVLILVPDALACEADVMGKAAAIKL